ncbi:MAG: hypothetical protein KF819_00135 [Labilithrix sp.]|nr:hypothetical protein [Labilithrix sp.]
MKSAACLFVLAIGVGLLACGDDEGGLDAASIRPAQLFSGFDDGTTEFKVPATLGGVDAKTNVRWSVGNTAIAEVETEQPPAGQASSARYTQHAIVKTKKAGKTVLRATAGGKTFEVPLTVTQYAPGARDLGNDLYQEDRSGTPEPGAEPYVKGLGCIACHGIRGGPGHSPSEIGGYDDATILVTIKTAKLPQGGLANRGDHKFSLDAKQEEGILARLRSLEPVTFPE